MSVIFHRIKEGEFIRLAQAHGINDIFIQESQITPNKYHLLGINTQTKIGYVVRHGRTDSMREWRLDILAALIVRMNPDYTD